MSRLLEPSGPLPPRVYWMRRLFVLIGLVLVIALAWWAIGRATASSSPPASAGTHRPAPATGASSSPPAASGTRHPASSQPTVSHPPSGSGTSQRPTTQPRNAAVRPRQAKQQPTLAVPTHVLASTPAAPGGPCEPSTIGIAVHATPMMAGNPHNITLWLTGPEGSSCTLSLGPDSVVVQLTSGPDRIWSSDNCPEALPTKNVRVSSGSPARYTFRWDGFRSTRGCRNDVTMAKPGGYWVHAALLGGEPTEAYFTVKPRA